MGIRPLKWARIAFALVDVSFGGAGGGICMFPFMDLCGKPVAAADYIALCDSFHTLVLKGVPMFTGSKRQEGYR